MEVVFSEENLPEEILTMIFEYFSYNFVQKVCTLVSKRWFNIIRNNQKFSSSLGFDANLESFIKPAFFHQFLAKSWPKICELHLTCNQENLISCIDFKKLPNLKYIILDCIIPLFTIPLIKRRMIGNSGISTSKIRFKPQELQYWNKHEIPDLKKFLGYKEKSLPAGKFNDVNEISIIIDDLAMESASTQEYSEYLKKCENVKSLKIIYNKGRLF